MQTKQKSEAQTDTVLLHFQSQYKMKMACIITSAFEIALIIVVVEDLSSWKTFKQEGISWGKREVFFKKVGPNYKVLSWNTDL